MKQIAAAISQIAFLPLCCLLTASVLAGCAAGPEAAPAPAAAVQGTPAAYPVVTFMVLSDLHYYDPTLGTSGKAWDDYNAADRKLLKDSAESVSVAFETVTRLRPSFIIVTGDLTKDGERQCHEQFAARLKDLAEAGIPAYVVPGNHDIDNPDAARFLPSGGKERIPTVDPEEYARIYAADGYSQAINRDPSGLSYVAEPVPGLWLLALDSTKHERNAKLGYPETSGAISEPTYHWIEERLKEAAQKGIAVIAFEHHPLLEHFDGMRDKYPEYIVDDNWRLASLLAAYNVRLFFSGHYHASSIVMRRWGEGSAASLRGKYIVDVETGSLVTWPCSFRTVSLSDDGSAAISTQRVDQLPSYAAAGRSFDAEGKLFVESGISGIAEAAMRKLHVSQHDIDAITPDIVAAMMAHYAGNARFQGQEMLPTKGLGLMGSFVVASYGSFVKGIWKTQPPQGVQLMEDNDLTIAPDGSWQATGGGRQK